MTWTPRVGRLGERQAPTDGASGSPPATPRSIALVLFGLPTFLCVVVAAICLGGEVWSLSTGGGRWLNAHNTYFGFVMFVLLVNAALVVALAIWWIFSLRHPLFSHKIFAVWLAVLMVSAGSYFIPTQPLAAIATSIFTR